MGVWGVGIFDSDIAERMRDDFQRTLETGSSPREASEFVEGRFSAERMAPNEGPLFWIALAELQIAHSCLTAEVYQAATSAIESEHRHNVWGNLQARRKLVLDEFESRLRIYIAAARVEKAQ